MGRKEISLLTGICMLLFAASWLLHRSLSTPPPAKPYSETSGGILMSAERDFDSQDFRSAVSKYARYLQMKPDDLQARSNYGIALMFAGRAEKAVDELEDVVSKDALSFHANIYLALALSEKGDITAAREKAAEAMKLAPTDETRERIEDFVASLGK